MSEPAEAEVVTHMDQVTPAWLTEVLRRAGALGKERVARVEHECAETTFGTVARLRLGYTAAGAGPRRLFLKLTRPSPTPSEGDREARFYRHLASRTSAAVARCYDAAFSSRTGELHLLLEDLSGTHRSEPPSQLPPSRPDCERIVEALADLHAAWWEEPPWEVSGGGLPDRAEVERRIERVEASVSRFARFLGDRLSAERRGTYRRVLAGLPTLYTRLTEPVAYTLVHDDVHAGNVLQPRRPGRDTVRLVDWQTWHVDLAPKDLAHMMAVFWFPERRRALELPLLRRWHARLCERGVAGYAWERCWHDYRLCVLRKLFHPPWQWEMGQHPNLWWNHLERVMAAYRDLRCDELLG